MEDTILLICLIILLIFYVLYQSSLPPIHGTVIDKYFSYGFRGSGPFYYITIDTGDEIFSKSVNHYDYYYGYFIGYSYDF